MAALAAATVTATIDQGRRIFQINNGGKIAVLDIGLTTAASVINPAGTIALDSSDLRKMGLSKLLSILEATAWTSANVLVFTQTIWDGKGSKIMLYDAAGAALAATAIGNGGNLRLVVLGM